MSKPIDIGPRLRALRGEMPRSELARRSGVHAMAIAKLEYGGRDPRVSTVAKLARGLGVAVADLFAPSPKLRRTG